MYDLKIMKMHEEIKNQNLNIIKWGLNYEEIGMRGFQIWPPNSNRITSDPFFAKNSRKWTKYTI